jgi:hypothetical protein
MSKQEHKFPASKAECWKWMDGSEASSSPRHYDILMAHFIKHYLSGYQKNAENKCPLNILSMYGVCCSSLFGGSLHGYINK